jgi:hypothetical protein
MKEKFDKQKSQSIKMLKIVKGLSYSYIVVTVFLFSIIYIAIFNYPDPITTNELLNTLVLTTLIFLIFIAISLVFILIIHKKCNALIYKIKKRGSWQNYGEELLIIVPIVLTNSFFMLYMSLFQLTQYLIINDKNYLSNSIMFFIISLIFLLFIFIFSMSAKNQKDYEIINLGKIKYEDSKVQIESILKGLKLNYIKTGSKNALQFKVDETYLINDNFEVLLKSRVKEGLSKIWWPEGTRFTIVIVGKITKDNKKVVRKVQKEIEELKVNT